MNLRRVAWFGVWSLAVASWFSAASTPDVRPPAPVPAPGASSRDLDRSAAEMQAEIGRLHDRLAPSTSPVRARDLFHFATRAPQPAAHAVVAPAPAVVQAAEPSAPARPTLQLIGVAEDAVADAVVRTAIIAGLGDVFLVKAGESVAGRYRVEQVSSDAVQLSDSATSVLTTLTLR